MRASLSAALVFLLLGFSPSARAGDVAIYTGNVNWITKPLADVQAEICQTRLVSAGLNATWFANDFEATDLANWVSDHTEDGQADVLVLYGWFPDSIYQSPNVNPDGSIAELFIESTDGDAILNHGDWMFYVSSATNADAGLQNMMDVAPIGLGGGDNMIMTVTDQGREIAPSLVDFASDRHLDPLQLAGEWFVEAALAQSAGGRMDPVIIRDGSRGRLIMSHQTAEQNDPKGAVAAEIIAWLLEADLLPPSKIGLTTAAPVAISGSPVKITVSTLDESGTPMATAADVIVTLASNSATGKFDTLKSGAFDGAITTVTIPAGLKSATIYYKDPTAGPATLTGSAAPLTAGELTLDIIEDVPSEPGDVAIYTGKVGWIAKASADIQAGICANKLTALGIPSTKFPNADDETALADWVTARTGNGKRDVVVLYGFTPPSLYPMENAMPDGSVAELFIETTDGDTIMNHADYMFYVGSQDPAPAPCCNAEGGLRNMMDNPVISMWDDNTPMVVTEDGRTIAPSLSDFLSDRPLHVNELAGEWFVEAALAQNPDGSRADPVIVRDGNRGRLVPIFQAADQNDPKGSVAAEIIAWLFGVELGNPTKLGFTGKTAAWPEEILKFTVQVQEDTGSPVNVLTATLVNLATSSTTGKFDRLPTGPFNGTVKFVTVPAGQSSATFYYKDTAAGAATITAKSAGLADGTVVVKYVGRTFADPGDVAIYTGSTGWITKALADQQAGICAARLASEGITPTLFASDDEQAQLADWVEGATGNGRLDVLVLYGYLPDSLYQSPNVDPDGSVAELFIESTDGDTIINHADWMFYVSSAINGPAGLQNMMDLPGIVFGADNTAMTVTARGKEIAPSLVNFLSDRPLLLAGLGGDWLIEEFLAGTADGLQADPIILRDADRGRLIPALQAADQNDPKGSVAAEIIAWLFQTKLQPTKLVLSGSGALVTRTPGRFTVSLQDDAGIPMTAEADVTVGLGTDSATGAFDAAWDGSFGGAVTSVTIPAGASFATFFYKDSSDAAVTLTAASAPLAGSELAVNVLQDAQVEPGEVALYTGHTGWFDADPVAGKVLAEAQAATCIEMMDAAGIGSIWFPSDTDTTALADWMTSVTGDGRFDVLVLYGYFPDTLYTPANGMPDGSIAELFIESPDGDLILNHGDYMFYVSSEDRLTDNADGGLVNMMDIPGITMWDDDTPVAVTDAGAAIAPSLVNFASDRPFHMNELTGEWFVEAALGENAAGTRADPVIVRDGVRGRLAICHQTSIQDDPKGAVAAEMIIWLFSKTGSVVVKPIFRRGDADGSGKLDLTDAIFSLTFQFMGGTRPACMDTADADDSGKVDLTDAIFTLTFQFMGGTAPPAPGPVTCGPDPTVGDEYVECTYTNC